MIIDESVDFDSPAKCPYWEINTPAAIELKFAAHCTKGLHLCKYNNNPDEFKKINNDIRNCDIYKQ
jgi:hypothetical protein